MTFETFKEIIRLIRVHEAKCSKIYKLDIDLFNFMDNLSLAISLFWKAHYSEEGAGWIEWFLYERNPKGEKKQAWDEKGNAICYDLKSTWEYVDKKPKKMTDEQIRAQIEGIFNK